MSDTLKRAGKGAKTVLPRRSNLAGLRLGIGLGLVNFDFEKKILRHDKNIFHMKQIIFL